MIILKFRGSTCEINELNIPFNEISDLILTFYKSKINSNRDKVNICNESIGDLKKIIRKSKIDFTMTSKISTIEINLDDIEGVIISY